MTIFSQSVSTAEHDRLLKQLRDWCAHDRGRQTKLAIQIGVPRQTVSLWLTGRRKLSLDAWTRIEPLIQLSKDQNMPLRTPLFPPKRTPAGAALTVADAKEAIARTEQSKRTTSGVAALPDSPLDLMAGSPVNLHESKNLIAQLRSEITALKAGSTRASTSPAAPSPPVAKPAVSNIANTPVPIIPPTPTVKPAAKVPDPLSLLSTSDLCTLWKQLRQKGSAEAAQLVHSEIERRTTSKKAAAPKSLLPDSPKATREFLDDKSVPELKALLSQAVLTADSGALYAELKRRGE